jgi:hypothetical protein
MLEVLHNLGLIEKNTNPVMQLPSHPYERYCSNGGISIAPYILMSSQELTLAHADIIVFPWLYGFPHTGLEF